MAFVLCSGTTAAARNYLLECRRPAFSFNGPRGLSSELQVGASGDSDSEDIRPLPSGPQAESGCHVFLSTYLDWFC